jgi:hypothetical protein
MRKSLARTLAALGVTLALAAVTSTSGFAQHRTSVDSCPDGRVGLMVHQAAVQVSIPCALVTDTPGPIVGLLVRQPDGSARTVDLAADDGSESGASMDALTDEIVGLVVQQSDGSVTTIDLAAENGTETQSSAVSSSSTSSASAVSSSSTSNASAVSSSTTSSASVSNSTSTSTSTSTTCVNGQCTTTTAHSVCADDTCSD